MELAVRKIAAARDESTAWLSLGTAVKILLAIPLTQALYGFMLISAMFVREVRWRGVAYRIEGPWKIRLIEYRPYEATSADVSVSL